MGRRQQREVKGLGVSERSVNGAKVRSYGDVAREFKHQWKTDRPISCFIALRKATIKPKACFWSMASTTDQ